MTEDLAKAIYKHSQAYAELVNLIEVAKLLKNRTLTGQEIEDARAHVKYLTLTAQRLLPYVWMQEKADAIIRLTDFKWNI